MNWAVGPVLKVKHSTCESVSPLLSVTVRVMQKEPGLMINAFTFWALASGAYHKSLGKKHSISAAGKGFGVNGGGPVQE